MTKTKWHSKLLSLSIAFALIFSLVAMVVPVAAQDVGDLDLSVTINATTDRACCGATFNITATIINNTTPGEGSVDAVNVTAELDIIGNAKVIGGPWPASGSYNVTEAGGTQVVQWEVECTGKDVVVPTEFTVTVEADNHTGDPVESNTVQVVQDSGWLLAVITSPVQDDVVPVGTVFDVEYYVINTGCNNVTSVFVEISTIAGAEITGGGDFTTEYLGRINVGENVTGSISITCTGVGPAVLHVDPIGRDLCSNKEIEGDSAVVEITQVFGVTCNVTPNPTKVDHNVTFTAKVGEDAELPLSYNWTFGDDSWASGTSASVYIITETHSYSSAGNYTVHCSVTDSSTVPVTVNCTGNITVQVYPVLGVNAALRAGTYARVEDRNMAKTDAEVCFNATRIDGLESPCYDGNDVVYSWLWDFDDGTNSTAQNPCHTFNTAGNYTVTVTLTDDCLYNEESAYVTIEIYPPLSINCTADPLETKVSDDRQDAVTFNVTVNGGLPAPPVTYNWHWNFGDGGTASDSGSGPDFSTTHQYETPGTYNATVTVWDGTAINNTATCNQTIVVWPGLNVTCDVTPTAQTICEDVFFSATRSGGVPANNYTWEWTFSDNTTATGQNVTKQFDCVGNWTGTVTITDTVLENTANCTTEAVVVTIEPPVLLAPELNETVLSRWVAFNWTDIGCVDYTLEVWQKDGSEAKVLLVDTGLDSFWTGWIMDGDAYRWQVTATDACNNTATTESSYFKVQDTYLAVSVDAPLTGDSFTGDSTTTVIWSTTRNDSFAGFGASGDEAIEVALFYSTNSGTSWTSIEAGLADTGSRAWTTPPVNSDNCLIKAVATDGYGNVGVGISGLFSISTEEEPVPVTSYNITLNEGWNLISLPLIPTSNNITDVLAGVSGIGNVTQVWAYDPTLLPGDAWVSCFTHLPWSANELKEMNDGVGYWIVVSGGTATLTVNGQGMPGPGEMPPMYDVYEGWNLIGMKSIITRSHEVYLVNIEGDYTVIWGYDTVSGNYELVYPIGSGLFNPGEGFWIYMSVDGMIIPAGY